MRDRSLSRGTFLNRVKYVMKYRLRGMKCCSIFIVVLFILFSCARDVEYLGVFGKSRMKDVLGQDGVTPIDIDDSITMWTFGDTILGTWKKSVTVYDTFDERVNPEEMISNSLAFTPRVNSDNVQDLDFTFFKRGGKVVQFIEFRKGEAPRFDRLWAVDGLRVDNTVYVYYLIIRITKPGDAFQFKLRAVGLARWEIPESWGIGDDVRFVRRGNIFPADYPGFGASVIQREGYIYTVGQYSTRDMASPIKVARVKVDTIEDSDAYEFLAKEGRWVRDIDRAEPFLGDVMGECSLSYNSFLKRYVVVYCQLWTGKIVMVSFKEFSELGSAQKREVFRMPDLKMKDKREIWYYSGKEIFAESHFIYAICINPLEYQPYLLKIRLQDGGCDTFQ
jgi:hypothetical protein